MAEIQLYTYFRSSASYRVRIALHLKKISFETKAVHLLKDGGEQHDATFRKLNSFGEVPCIVHQGEAIGQSMAILQYLDQLWPHPQLFPEEALKKAQVLQICEMVNSGIHPLQNLKVLQKLQREHGLSADDSRLWAKHWIETGFLGLEKMLERTAGTYALGGQLTAADLFIVPQVFNARRFNVPLENFPHICRVEANALQLEAFKKAQPAAQPDAQP